MACHKHPAAEQRGRGSTSILLRARDSLYVARRNEMNLN